VVVFETALFGYAARLVVAVVISDPYGRAAEMAEAAVEKCVDCFGYQPLPPVRNGDPVSDLGIVGAHAGAMQRIAGHYAAAADRLVRGLRDYGIYLRCGEYGADHVEALCCRAMRRPPGRSAHGRVLGISV